MANLPFCFQNRANEEGLRPLQYVFFVEGFRIHFHNLISLNSQTFHFTGMRTDEQLCSSRSSSVGPGQTGNGNSGRISGLERATSADSDNEISKNRDFYRTHDVRPPFTYAALIRQVNVCKEQ